MQHFSLITDILIYLFSDKKECLTGPCLNGGKCYETLGSFYCTCVDGFIGPFCGLGIKLVDHGLDDVFTLSQQIFIIICNKQ